MSRVPADYREFVRVSVDLPANPKLAMIDDPAAGWAYVVSLCYCGQHLTDGTFPMGPLMRLAGVKPAIGKKLIQAGLWHESGHTCERCPQPMAGTGVVHDYLVHQRSAGEAKALRDARREAGRKGASSRWSSNGDGKSHSNSHGNSHEDAMANGELDLGLPPGNSMPEGEVEGDKEQKKTSSSRPTPPPRDDVERLTMELVHRVEANEFKSPANLNGWRKQARLLLDVDKRELDQASRLIDWSTGHHFWHRNIRSMDKFRAQYDRLLADAKAEQRTGSTLRAVSGGYVPWQNPADQSVYDEPLLPPNPTEEP